MSDTLLAATDIELLGAYREGDAAAFATLYDRYRSQIYAYLRRRCGSQRGAAVFVDVWREIVEEAEPQAEVEFAAQLFGVAHSLARLRASSGDLVASDPTSPSREFTQRTRHRALSYDRALRSVDTVDRDAYLLYEEGGLTLNEVGGILGTGAEGARGHVRRTLRVLQDALESPPVNRLELHDPNIAVAHLAARQGPGRELDVVVLSHAERIAAEHLQSGGNSRARHRRNLRIAATAVVISGLLLFALQEVDLEDQAPAAGSPRTTSAPLSHYAPAAPAAAEAVGDAILPVQYAPTTHIAMAPSENRSPTPAHPKRHTEKTKSAATPPTAAAGQSEQVRVPAAVVPAPREASSESSDASAGSTTTPTSSDIAPVADPEITPAPTTTTQPPPYGS